MRKSLIVAALLLSGCVSSPISSPNRALPWNWFRKDATAALAAAQGNTAQAQGDAVHAAGVEVRKAEVALESAPPSPQVDLAKRFVGNAGGILNQVSPLTAKEDAFSRSIVAGFLSFQPDLVADAEKRQAAAEKNTAKISDALTKSEAREKELTEKLKVSNTANAVDASKYRRLWFWIWTAIGFYVFIQILPVISKLFPAFAPVAKAASWIAAPAVQAGYSRLRQAVGETIHAAKASGAISLEKLREKIDGPIDPAEQQELHKQFEKAAAAEA